MALTRVRGGAIDNPLTLGGGSASDNSIIFDGNAQDFHIGLDDSTDSLTIGKGSVLGTTPNIIFNSDNESVIEKLTFPGSGSIITDFRHGDATISTGTSASSYVTYTSYTPTYQISAQNFTFGSQMSSVPSYINVFQKDGNQAGHSSIQRMWTDNLTATGFTLYVSDTDSSSGVVICYVALCLGST